uniref:Uncharacterized protein n=1 Tax=Rhodnius prolixus TaxID=13249 RepID=T1H935_RHOPR
MAGILSCLEILRGRTKSGGIFLTNNTPHPTAAVAVFAGRYSLIHHHHHHQQQQQQEQ